MNNLCLQLFEILENVFFFRKAQFAFAEMLSRPRKVQQTFVIRFARRAVDDKTTTILQVASTLDITRMPLLNVKCLRELVCGPVVA